MVDFVFDTWTRCDELILSSLSQGWMFYTFWRLKVQQPIFFKIAKKRRKKIDQAQVQVSYFS